MRKQELTTKYTMIAMFSAIAFVVMSIGRVPMMSIPGLTLKYDPKDIVIIICGFIYGPLSSAIVSVMVSLLEMFTVSDNGMIGMLMNIISSCFFACTAALIYKYKRKLSGAVIGLIIGCIFTSFVMVLWNYLITPIYLNIPTAAITPYLFTFFLPFNLIKGSINAAATMIIYKPVSKLMLTAFHIPVSENAKTVNNKNRFIVIGIAVAVIAMCIGIVFLLK